VVLPKGTVMHTVISQVKTLMKMFSKILEEVGTLLVATVAVLLVWPWFWIWDVIPVGLIPIGILYTVSKPFYDYRKRPWKERWRRIGRWFLYLLYQTWNVIKYVFLAIGYIIDLYGNVILGEVIEDIVTAEEQTMFSMGEVTISAALGDLKRRDKLNQRGIILCNILSFLDPANEDHCISAIEMYELRQKQKRKS
jgi:hypothetical protein